MPTKPSLAVLNYVIRTKECWSVSKELIDMDLVIAVSLSEMKMTLDTVLISGRMFFKCPKKRA